MADCFRPGIILILFLFLGLYAISQDTENYEYIFNDDYKEALVFILSRPWLADSLRSFGINSCNALSVVFPELIRYSSIMDKIETQSLKSLYVQYGKEYSDFSIGYFQMKPSFAENLEKDFISFGENISRLNLALDTANTETSRKVRVERLSTLNGQLDYLAIFMVIMEKKLMGIFTNQDEEKVRYISTAYNSDYKADRVSITTAMERDFFYTGIISPVKKYNYSDISVSFYRKYCEKVGF
jgi:hypothetical protein